MTRKNAVNIIVTKQKINEKTGSNLSVVTHLCKTEA